MLPILEAERTFNASFSVQYTQSHLEVPIFAVALYVAMVFWVPTVLSKPLRLNTLFAVWNLSLSLFSIVGATRVVPHLLSHLQEKGFRYTVCSHPSEWYTSGPASLWVMLFIFSKLPELLDTFFLVFQKKPVIFLHWFHHITVLLYCWHAFHVMAGPGIWFAGMNYVVHSVMYLYYFFASVNLKQLARPIAPLITTLQILQMVVGSFVTTYTAMQRVSPPADQPLCWMDDANWKLGLGMYVSYLLLFCKLFYDHYLRPDGKHKRTAPKVATTTNAGSSICSSGDSAGFFRSGVVARAASPDVTAADKPKAH